MEQFLTTTSCRRYFILSYFDKNTQHPDMPDPECCDNCAKRFKSGKEGNGGEDGSMVDFGEDARKLFRALELFNGKTGLNKPIDFLRGSENVCLSEGGCLTLVIRKFLNFKKVMMTFLNKHKSLCGNELYGSGKDKSEIWWREFGKLMRNNGYLHECKSTFSQFGFLTQLSPKADEWLIKGEKVDMDVFELKIKM